MSKGWIPAVVFAAIVLSGCGGSSNGPAITEPVSITGVFAGEADVPGVGPAKLTLCLESRENVGRGQVVVHGTGSQYRRTELTHYSRVSDRHRVQASILDDEDHVLEVRPVGDSPTPNQVVVSLSRGGQTREVTFDRKSDFVQASDSLPIPNGAEFSFHATGLSLHITIVSLTSDGNGGWNVVAALAAPTGGYDSVAPSSLVGTVLNISTVGGFLYDSSTNFTGSSPAFVCTFPGFINGELTRQ